MKPKYITIHCSATPPSKPHIGVIAIREMHTSKNPPWSDIGYHWVIKRNGDIQPGRPITRSGAGVEGHNKDNIHICIVGGVDEDGKAEFNYTNTQMDAVRYLISELSGRFGIKQENIKGHRDWYGDENGDGVLDKYDWLKECPCFDVKSKLEEWRA